MMNTFKDKQEIQLFLADCARKIMEATTTYEERSFSEQIGLINVNAYLPTAKDCVKCIKDAGYTLDNFKDDATFDQEWITIYNEID